MRLIDADRLDKEMSEEDYIKEGEMISEYVDRMRSIIDNQPTVFPVFSCRSAGKKLFSDYYNVCKVLDNYGLDSTNPAETLSFVLEQYQKIICELTGSFLSKLTYYADTVIAKVQDRQNDDIHEAVDDTVENLSVAQNTVNSKCKSCKHLRCICELIQDMPPSDCENVECDEYEAGEISS